MEREGIHTSPENLLFYVHQVIESTAENISSMLQDIRAQRRGNRLYHRFSMKRARARPCRTGKRRLFELVKQGMNMSASALICLAW
jgi:2-dehydropantoate 2-reductase